MPHLIARTILGLKEPFFWKILFLCVAINMGLFIVLITFFTYTAGTVDIIPFIDSFLFSGFLGAGIALILTWLLFPLFLPLIVTFFYEEIVQKIEKKYYPDHIGTGSIVWPHIAYMNLRFISVAILLNILLLPFMLFPPIYLLFYYVVNGYLIGREFFELVASSHLDYEKLKAVRRQNRFPISIGGMAVVFTFGIPVLNFIVAPLGIIFMVHLFHKLVYTISNEDA